MTGSGEKMEKTMRIQVNLANKLLSIQCSDRPPRARRYLRNLRIRKSGSRPVYSVPGAGEHRKWGDEIPCRTSRALAQGICSILCYFAWEESSSGWGWVSRNWAAPRYLPQEPK